MVMAQLTSVTDEVVGFLVSSPTPEQIVAFHASEQAQPRLRTLLEHNQEGVLTEPEKAELDEMSRVEHFFTLIKARAMKMLRDQAVVTAR